MAAPGPEGGPGDGADLIRYGWAGLNFLLGDRDSVTFRDIPRHGDYLARRLNHSGIQVTSCDATTDAPLSGYTVLPPGRMTKRAQPNSDKSELTGSGAKIAYRHLIASD